MECYTVTMHLDYTFLSVIGSSGHHCPYVGCHDGIFSVHNVDSYSHPSLNEYFTYKYLPEQVIHMLNSFS
jgi:hypothetical protein